MLLSANTAAGESGSGRISSMDSAGGMGSEDSMHCAGSSAGLFGVSAEEDEELEKYLAYIHTVYSVFGFGLCSVVLKKTGEVIGAMPVSDNDSLILLTSTNKIIRLSVDEVRSVGRAAMGVRLVRLDDGASVVGFDTVADSGENEA
jgi:hypothetical protein